MSRNTNSDSYIEAWRERLRREASELQRALAEARAKAKDCAALLARFGASEVCLIGSVAGSGRFHEGSDIDLISPNSPAGTSTSSCSRRRRRSWSGVERVFERIAVELDGELPRGADWRGQLLNRMEEEVEGVRPRVLTADLAARLRSFLRFRHLFLNIYGGQLRWERSTGLLAEADEVWPLLEQQMQEFKGVLGQLHDGCR